MIEPNVINLIVQAFKKCRSEDGWVNLASLGNQIRGFDPTFNAETYGFDRLSSLLAAQEDLLELRRDDTRHVPVIYGRLKNEQPGAVVRSAQARPTRQTGQGFLSAPSRQESYLPGHELARWAWLGSYLDVLPQLATKALDEQWDFRQSHADPSRPHPILLSYLRYTFYRLKLEGKVSVKHADGKSFAAFNTGLVDERYEPIYALLRPNPARNPAWQLSSFCIAAEDLDGKTLVRYFNPLPQPAHYFDSFEDVLYDVRSPDPQLDWEHIILENVDRIPVELIRERCPAHFELKDFSSIPLEGREHYFAELAAAIKAHPATYRIIKNRMQDALHLSLKRVRWNFKTAIPTYFPKRNRISLLLPLPLLSDEQVDRALVVERTPSGNYLGHTILPLDWAYSNARLVCRPDSDWLAVQKITSASTLEDDSLEA
jgi:hypothetical protein